jgi:hypothetical protein
MYGELKWLSGRTLREAGLLSRTTARKSIGHSKRSQESAIYRKAGYSSSSKKLTIFTLILFRDVTEILVAGMLSAKTKNRNDLLN